MRHNKEKQTLLSDESLPSYLSQHCQFVIKYTTAHGTQYNHCLRLNYRSEEQNVMINGVKFACWCRFLHTFTHVFSLKIQYKEMTLLLIDIKLKH